MKHPGAHFHRFFETEGIVILSTLLSQYKITIKEEPQFAHETFEERKARVLDCQLGLTLTPLRVPPGLHPQEVISYTYTLTTDLD